MKKLAGLLAFALVLSFGPIVALTYAGEPAPPAPTDEKDKKNPGMPKLNAGDEKKDAKKDGKGGK
jgi:hypothetical protein